MCSNPEERLSITDALRICREEKVPMNAKEGEDWDKQMQMPEPKRVREFEYFHPPKA